MEVFVLPAKELAWGKIELTAGWEVDEKLAIVAADDVASADYMALKEALDFSCVLPVVALCFYDWGLDVDECIHNCTLFWFKNLSISRTLMNIRFPILLKGMSPEAMRPSIHLRDTPRYSCASRLLIHPRLTVGIGYCGNDGRDDECFAQP